MKRVTIFFAVLAIAALMLTACGQKTTTKPTSFRVGYVTDTGGIDDKSFNTNQWEGIQRAANELGIEAKFIQSDEASQYVPNLTEFASQGYDLVIASGFLLSGAVAEVAAQYPEVKFTIVDANYPDPWGVPEGVVGHAECIPNVMGQIFKTDQAAYLAGYLAAGMAMQLDPADPKLGYFGGMKIPTVTIFGVGFQHGMEAYNAAHGTNVQLVGWDNATGEGLFTGDFVDIGKGQQAAESLADEGADVLMGVGGIIGSPAMIVAKDRGKLAIWVDTDGYLRFTEYQSVLLTSVMKRMDNVQYNLIKQTMEGKFQGCHDFVGEMANGGVGIAPYHDLESRVPADLKAEVEALKAKITSGEITDTGCISYPASCPGGLYP